MDDRWQLRALHDSYVWEVNAAVGEGRLDLVWQLADQYLDEAFQIVAGDEAAGCGRPDCTVCTGRRPAPVRARRRRHLLRRLLW
jgi:hypothetical protein